MTDDSISTDSFLTKPLCSPYFFPLHHARTVAHNVAIQMSKRGLSPRHHPSAIEQQVSVRSKVFGKTFENPIGLGAGFDKDAEIIQPVSSSCHALSTMTYYGLASF
jgi:hypothetical protein